MATICRVFIATSVDGFIARADGSIDWLEQANAMVPPGQDCGYGAFMASVDALVMGRNTFDTVHRMQPWPYGEKPVYVLSRSLAQLPHECPPSVRLVQGGPADAVAQAAAQGHHSLYVDGGLTIQAFLAAGLVSELIITVIPVLLGSGRPLFGPLPRDTRLRLVGSHAFEFGFVQSHYAVASEA
jgi:dihydrofolate reductase